MPHFSETRNLRKVYYAALDRGLVREEGDEVEAPAESGAGGPVSNGLGGVVLCLRPGRRLHQP